ncbi:MAG: carbohydrate-binding family 9-like protein [Acidobacteria bacterium]|nr:carbohydrate-binding family 9-like protein [Acidobacteriota bacterium]
MLPLLLAAAGMALPDGPGVMVSRHSNSDFPLTPDPDSTDWKGLPAVFMERGPLGEPVPGHRTEIRSRWTADHLYFLFICPYEELNLKPGPVRDAETAQLWDWDVAEVFVGWDAKDIYRYKEFEISPQGEWVDLDIDRTPGHSMTDIKWNSGFRSDARIDAARKVWYGVMKIPLAAIDPRPPANGVELRLNLYRCQGAGPNRKFIAWQPTGSRSYHVPQAFGKLRLEGK